MRTLVENLIKQSVDYKLNHIKVARDGENQIAIFNANSHKLDSFYAMRLVSMFNELPNISTYIWYNKEKCRVELIVFWN